MSTDGRDVLAPVYAVAGGADDLRHVRPDRVEAGAVRTARDSPRPETGILPVSAWFQVVSRMSGFQYSSPMSRNSGLTETLSSPLVQPCTQERHALHSSSVSTARQRVAVVRRLVPVHVVEAAQLDAVGAAGAVLAPIDVAELAHPAEPRGRSERCECGIGQAYQLPLRPIPLLRSLAAAERFAPAAENVNAADAGHGLEPGGHLRRDRHALLGRVGGLAQPGDYAHPTGPYVGRRRMPRPAPRWSGATRWR